MHKEVRHVLIAVPIIVLLAVVVTLLRSPRSAPNDPPPLSGARIAALSPAFGVILAELDAAELVVARHGYDRLLPASVPAAGDQSGIDYEALLKANPTHVLTQWGTRDYPPRMQDLAGTHGWWMRDYRLLSIEEVGTATYDVGAIVGREREARALIERMQEVLAAPDQARYEARVRLGPVLLLGAVNPPAAFGPGSWHHDLLLRAGFESALSSSASAWVNLDAEDVLRLNPSAIVLIRATPGETPGSLGDVVAPSRVAVEVARGGEAAEVLGRLTTLPTEAGETGRVATLDHPQSQIPGPHVAVLAEALYELLDGWADEGSR